MLIASHISKRYHISSVMLAAALTFTSPSAQAQERQLQFTGAVRLLDCQPVTSRPCFEANLNVVDANGAPSPISLPSEKALRSNLAFSIDGEQVHPFYAMAAGAAGQRVQGRLALVLVDISGSMNSRMSSGETRFEAAKAALNSFVVNFQDKVDQIAIIPFESHHVVAGIKSYSFATTREEALRKIASLPEPQPKNNTGLYSAVNTGLDVLEERRQQPAASDLGAPADTMLIVMTDGSNEVLKGDDPDLLTDTTGLATVANRVKTAPFPVIGIGIGDSGQVDMAALQQISSRTYMAQDAGSLQAAFGFARKLLDDRILAMFLSPWPDRASLAGRSFQIQADLTLPDGTRLTGQPVQFDSPAIGPPLFEGKASRAEVRALLGSQPVRETDMSILRPVLVFIGITTTLLLLWFWLPRLVWPDRYIGMLPIASRWTKPGQTGVRRNIGAKSMAPFGFSKDKGAPPAHRAPADATFVQSRLGPRQTP